MKAFEILQMKRALKVGAQCFSLDFVWFQRMNISKKQATAKYDLVNLSQLSDNFTSLYFY